MARKTKEEAQQTRTQLLEAAARLFCERGVSATSLHDIAEAAGLTRGAVYWHFDNKGDLLLALWEQIESPMQQAFEQLTREQAHDPLERIRRRACWMAERIEHCQKIRTFMTIMMLRCEFTTEMEASRQHFLAVRHNTLLQFNEEFQAAIAAGHIKPSNAVSQLSFGLFGLVDGVCFHWLIEPTGFDIAAVTHQTVSAYLLGLQA